MLLLNVKNSEEIKATITSNGTINLSTKDKIVDDNIIVELSGATDTSDATATANDILQGKFAYIADGSRAQGTISTYNWTTRYAWNTNPTTKAALSNDFDWEES